MTGGARGSSSVWSRDAQPPPTLVEWFAKTIEVTNDPDDNVGRMFATNVAMAAVPDISEATVINFLQGKGLRPEGTGGGKMAQKRVFIGGRPKTTKEQSTEVSAKEPNVEAHTDDGIQEHGSSSDEMKAYEKNGCVACISCE